VAVTPLAGAEFVGAETEPTPSPFPTVAVVAVELVTVARTLSRGAEDAATVEVTDDVGDGTGHR
jgi:hypothetical protein